MYIYIICFMCIYIYKDSVGALTFLALQDQGFQIRQKLGTGSLKPENFPQEKQPAKKFTPPGQSSKPELPGQSVK